MEMPIIPTPPFRITAVPNVDIPIRMPDDDYAKYWLNHSRAQNQPIPQSATLPDWLSATPHPTDQTALPKFPRTRQQIELEEIVFGHFFETFVDAIVINGRPLELIRADPRGIDPGRFMRWIKKDNDRQTRFKEAQEIAAELLVYQSDSIAEGVESLEDIERSKLRLRQNEFKIKAWNSRYRDNKQVDINMNHVIDMRALLEQRDAQLLTLEGEYALING